MFIDSIDGRDGEGWKAQNINLHQFAKIGAGGFTN